MNMQLVTWRDGRAANEAFVARHGRRATHLATAIEEWSIATEVHAASVAVVARLWRFRATRRWRSTTRPSRSRNSVTATVKELLVRLQQAAAQPVAADGAAPEHVHGPCQVSGCRNAPRWRIHDFENPGHSCSLATYHAALNYGDAAGRGVHGRQPSRDRRRGGPRTVVSSGRAQALLSAPGHRGPRPTPPSSPRPTTAGRCASTADGNSRRSTASSATSPTTRWSRAPRPSSTRSVAPCSSARGSARPASSCSTAWSSNCSSRANGRGIRRPPP